MIKASSLFALLLVVSSACSSIPMDPEDVAQCGPRPTDAQASAAVQVFVDRGGLKDPSSAQVRDIRIESRMSWFNGLVNGGGYTYGWQVAFELNAKNSFGAYVGFKTRHVLVVMDGSTRWKYEPD